MPALHHLLLVDGHIVAEVVEAEFVVRAVGDVGGVGRAALGRRFVVDDEADGEAEEAIDLAHPFGVALGEVVVDGDDVDALAGQRVEVGREDGNERFALAGLHLGDAALMEHDAADDLHTVRAHAEHAVCGLADSGECLGQKLVKRLAGGETVLEFLRFGAEILVGEGTVIVLEGHDGVDQRRELFDLALGAGTEELIE